MDNSKICILGIIGSLLTGCSFLSPVAAPQTNTYLVQSSGNYSVEQKSPASTVNLMVTEPTAPSWLNNTNMVYQMQPTQIDYFSKNAWADTPSHMLQNSVITNLQQSGHFHAVVAEPFSGNYDKRLDLRILNFSQDFSQNPSQFKLQVLAVLVNGQTQQVIASQMFNEIVPSQTGSPSGGVAAANIAVARLNHQLLLFASQKDNLILKQP